MVRREYVRVDPESNCVDRRAAEGDASCCGVNLAFVVWRLGAFGVVFLGFGSWGLFRGLCSRVPSRPCPAKVSLACCARFREGFLAIGGFRDAELHDALDELGRDRRGERESDCALVYFVRGQVLL